MAGQGVSNGQVVSPFAPPIPTNHDRYLELYKAIVRGDKTRAMSLIRQDPGVLISGITERAETPLHVAVGLSQAAHMVASLMRQTAMRSPISHLVDNEGNTVLIVAAMTQNLRAAKLLIVADRDLLWRSNHQFSTPVTIAAKFGCKLMVRYLMCFWEEQVNRMTVDSLIDFVKQLIVADAYDLVLHILEDAGLFAPNRATGASATPGCFEVFLKLIAGRSVEHDICTNLYFVQVIKSLCKKILASKVYSLFKAPILSAAESGVLNVVEEILISYPSAIWFQTDEGHNVFHLSAINRHSYIFGLLCWKYGHKNSAIASKDRSGMNILHMVADGIRLAEVNYAGGPALKMQYELKWFQKVEKQLLPSYRTELYNNKSPSKIFSEKHKELVKDGENWMKGAATAGSVAATLIATVVFTAVINVPGGSKDGFGSPNLRGSTLFQIFLAADGLGLFFSIASVLMFISILASGFSESSFLFVLPQRLLMGLLTLVVSLTCMLIAFWAAFLCATGNDSSSTTSWILLQLTYIPGLLFVMLLWPLIFQMIKLTWLPNYVLIRPPVTRLPHTFPKILPVLLLVERFNMRMVKARIHVSDYVIWFVMSPFLTMAKFLLVCCRS